MSVYITRLNTVINATNKYVYNYKCISNRTKIQCINLMGNKHKSKTLVICFKPPGNRPAVYDDMIYFHVDSKLLYIDMQRNKISVVQTKDKFCLLRFRFDLLIYQIFGKNIINVFRYGKFIKSLNISSMNINIDTIFPISSNSIAIIGCINNVYNIVSIDINTELYVKNKIPLEDGILTDIDMFINSNNFDMVFSVGKKEYVFHYNYDNEIKLLKVRPGYLLFNNYILKIGTVKVSDDDTHKVPVKIFDSNYKLLWKITKNSCDISISDGYIINIKNKCTAGIYNIKSRFYSEFKLSKILGAIEVELDCVSFHINNNYIYFHFDNNYSALVNINLLDINSIRFEFINGLYSSKSSINKFRNDYLYDENLLGEIFDFIR
jgi:hypothetical protein